MSGIGFSQVHSEAIESMKSQLLIVLIKRLGGNIDISVDEIDTGQDLLAMQLDPEKRLFHFEIAKKS